MSAVIIEAKQETSFFGGLKARLSGGDLGLIPVIIGLAIIWIVFQSVNSHFLSGRNLSNLILQIVEIGMLAIGETFILLLGEIDLSIGAVSGVSAAVLVSLSAAGMNPWLCIFAAIVSGAIIGAFQGLWVTFIGVPAFIVTLAGQLALQGVILAMLGNSGTVPILNTTLLGIASTYVSNIAGWIIVVTVVVLFALASFLNQRSRSSRNLPASGTSSLIGKTVLLVIISSVIVGVLNSYQGVPLAGFILLIFVVFFAFITQSTVYGRHIYALGGNAEASRRAGIRVRSIRM